MKIKLKSLSDTSAPKMDTLMKIRRQIGDTAAQLKKAEEVGVKSQSDLLKKRLEEKKKALLEAKKQQQ